MAMHAGFNSSSSRLIVAIAAVAPNVRRERHGNA